MHQGYNSLSGVYFEVNLAKRKDNVYFCIKQVKDGLEMSLHCAYLHLYHTSRFLTTDKSSAWYRIIMPVLWLVVVFRKVKSSQI